jgi:hypothetical protein
MKTHADTSQLYVSKTVQMSMNGKGCKKREKKDEGTEA